MSCNCNNIYPDLDLRVWSVCQSTDLYTYFYTKAEIDEKLANIDVDADLSQYYTKTETNNLLSRKLDASAYTQTDLTGYATQQWVGSQGYLTQHQPLKTINGNSLVGTGNIEIESETVDLSNYYNKAETNSLLSRKLDASAYTQTDLSQYWTSAQTKQAIDALSGEVVDNEYVVSQAINDLNTSKQDKLIAGANITISGNVISSTGGGGSADLTNYYTKTEVDNLITNKADASSVTPINDALTAHTADTGIHVSQAEKNAWNAKMDASGMTQYATTANTYTKQEVNNIVDNKFWCGTQAQYDALTNKENGVLYLIYEI